MVLSPQHIKSRLKQLGIRPDKYLGQHFLVDAAVLAKIIETARTILAPEDTIVEVGPGLGVLTQELLQFNHPILAVEKDPILAQNLASGLNNPLNLEVKQSDILKLLTPNSLRQLADPSPFCVIANIAYGITSPLLRQLVSLPHPPHHILVLVQKEVAERICAEPGNPERGLLTVEVELVGHPTILASVSPESFWPEPEVHSALLHIDLRQPPLGLSSAERAALLTTAAAGFSGKRKQLANSLAGTLHVPVSEVRQKLQKVGIDSTRRAETLTLDEWQKVAKVLKTTLPQKGRRIEEITHPIGTKNNRPRYTQNQEES